MLWLKVCSYNKDWPKKKSVIRKILSACQSKVCPKSKHRIFMKLIKNLQKLLNKFCNNSSLAKFKCYVMTEILKNLTKFQFSDQWSTMFVKKISSNINFADFFWTSPYLEIQITQPFFTECDRVNFFPWYYIISTHLLLRTVFFLNLFVFSCSTIILSINNTI